MTAAWSPEQLKRIGRAEELQIAAKRADGTLRRWVPIWVVCVGEQVFVRTWYRRDNGWFGHVGARWLTWGWRKGLSWARATAP
jgi:hypothetical protein